jgi:hypothetical protein
MQGDGNHAAQHDELALGKINDAGGVVNDIKAYGHNCVNAAIGYPGKEILNKKLGCHWCIINKGKAEFSLFAGRKKGIAGFQALPFPFALKF